MISKFSFAQVNCHNEEARLIDIKSVSTPLSSQKEWKSMLVINNSIVFNFPSIYSTVWVDFSKLFDLFHTYLNHGTVMGSNVNG